MHICTGRETDSLARREEAGEEEEGRKKMPIRTARRA
jgi:hypothetical protein